MVVSEQPLVCVGYKQFTTELANAISLDPPLDAAMAHVIAEDQIVRYRSDGTAPTATVGMPIQANTVGQWLPLHQLQSTKFIRAAAGAILNVQFYKPLDGASL